MGRRTFVAKKRMIIFAVLILLAAILSFLVPRLDHAVDREYKNIEIQGIRLFMTRDEVEKQHGSGAVTSPGCFGCEMEFAYPELGLSGRYSETLGRGFDFGVSAKSPKVKRLTTIEDSVIIFGIRVGQTFKQAQEALASRGFRLQLDANAAFYGYYFREGFYIRLWSDSEIDPLMKDRDDIGEDQDKVRSITIEVRIRDDEMILY